MSAIEKSRKCWECRKRRLVCDLAAPVCEKCAARGVACPGYGTKPLKWRAHQPALSKRSRDTTERADQQGVRCQSTEIIPRSLKADPSIRTPLEAIHYYNINICPELIATGDAGSRSPHFIPPPAVHLIPSSIIQIIVCVALCHRIVQLGEAPLDEQLALTTRLRSHRGAALRSITSYLGNPQQQTGEATLLAVVLLLMMELQISPSSDDWRRHCDAAHTIIDMRGGISSVVSSRLLYRHAHILAYLFVIDVVGCTTSPGVERARALRQLESLPLLPKLYGNGLGTVFSCPPDLFADIIRLNLLRSDVSLEGGERIRTAAEILRHILAFSPDAWAFGIMSRDQDHDNGETGGGADDSPSREAVTLPVRGTQSDWALVARIYQAAVALYSIGSSGDVVVTHGIGDVAAATNVIRKQLLDGLLRDLKTVASGSSSLGSQLRKVVIWPLLIAGIELAGDKEASRRFILEELKWIGVAAGTSSPAAASGFLKGLWARQPPRGCWDDLFDRPYIFAV